MSAQNAKNTTKFEKIYIWTVLYMRKIVTGPEKGIFQYKISRDFFD